MFLHEIRVLDIPAFVSLRPVMTIEADPAPVGSIPTVNAPALGAATATARAAEATAIKKADRRPTVALDLLLTVQV